MAMTGGAQGAAAASGSIILKALYDINLPKSLACGRVMLVGPTGSGKTVDWRTLREVREFTASEIASIYSKQFLYNTMNKDASKYL